MREAFIAGPGKKIISADYSQIELRIMAHLSGDKGFTEAFKKNMIITRMMMISKANRIIFRLCFAALCLLLILLFAIIPSFSFPVPYQ